MLVVPFSLFKVVELEEMFSIVLEKFIPLLLCFDFIVWMVAHY